MNSIPSGNRNQHKSFLFKLLGKQLSEPSLTTFAHLFFIICETIVMILYPVLHLFTSEGLMLSAQQSDFQSKNYKAIIVALLIPMSLTFITGTSIILVINFYQNSSIEKDQQNFKTKFIHRTLNKINVLMRTFLFMPILHFLISIFKLNIPNIIQKEIVLLLGIIGILEFIIVFFFLCLLTQAFNPFSNHPWASLSHFGTIMKSILKTLFVVFIQYGSSSTVLVLVIFQCLICIGWFVFAILVNQQYNQQIKIAERSMISICLWTCLFVLIFSGTNLFQINQANFAFLIIEIILSVISINYLFVYIENNHVEYFQKANKVRPIITGIILSINFIEKGIFYKCFSKHVITCRNPQCFCRKISCKIANQQPIHKCDYYQYLRQIISQKLSFFVLDQQKMYAQILLCYIYLQKLNMKNSSITILNTLKQKYSLNLYYKYRVQLLQLSIFNYIEELSEKNRIQLQIEKCYSFHKKYSSFRFLIFSVCNKIIDFWKNLNIKDYNMKLVYELTKQIMNKSEFVQKQFISLREINPVNKDIIIEYIEFRKHYFSEQVQEYQDQLSLLNKNIQGKGKYLDQMEVIFLNTAKPGIIVITANQHNFNIIHYANFIFLEKTSYFQRDVIGKSLDIFIPFSFRQNHSNGMKSYLSSGITQQSPVTKKIHILGSSNNILIGSMTVSLLNDVSEGLLFVGLINIQQNSQKLIFVSSEGDIYGTSLEFLNEFGKIVHNQISNILPNFNLNSLELGNIEYSKMTLVTQQPYEYDIVESQPTTYEVKIKLKQTRLMKNKIFYVCQIEPADRQLTAIIENKQQEISSNIQSIDLEQSNEDIEIQVFNNMISETILKRGQPYRLYLMKLLGLLSVFIMLALCIYNIYHFKSKMMLLIEQKTAILSLSKSNLRIVDNAVAGRKLNLLSFYNADEQIYSYYEKYYRMSIGKMGLVYYDINSKIMQLKERGFDESNADLKSTFWNYPNMKEDTYFYNLLTIYIQSATYLENSQKDHFAFNPLRLYNETPSIYKLQFEDIMINTYASLLPKLDIVTPAINNFWIEQIQKTNFIWYFIFIFVVAYGLALTIILIFFDYYYLKKYEKIVDCMGALPRSDIHLIISNIENYQYKMFKQYYQNNWIKALFYLFEDNDPTKKMRSSQENKNTMTSNNNSNILTPTQQDVRLRKKSKKQSSKNVNVDDEKKDSYNLRFKYRSHKHFLVYVFIVFIVAGYFVSDFVFVKIYLAKMIVTTQQLRLLLQRLKLISTIRFVTCDSLFELTPWPSNVSLTQQAKQYSRQLYLNQQKIQQFEITYPEWTPQFFIMDKANLCDQKYFYQNNDYDPTFDDCMNTFNGILTKGFSSSLSTFMTTAQNYYLLSNANMTTDKLKQIVFSPNYQQFHNLTEFLLSCIKYIRNIYPDLMDVKFQQYNSNFQKKGIVFCFVLFVLLGLWFYVMNKMNLITQQIKGLLKIITLNRIQNTDKLKKSFMENNIISSLK